MAIDFSDLHDEERAARFNQKPVDIEKEKEKARKPLLKTIASVRTRFEAGKGFRKPRVGQSWGKINHEGSVEWTPNHDGTPLYTKVVTFASEKVTDALARIEAAVREGKLDAVLGVTADSTPAPAKRRGRKPKSA